MRSYTKLYALIALTIAACADKAYDPDSPAIDPNAPRVHITSPERGTIAGDVHSVTVTGTASDDSGEVAGVTVNGVNAPVDSFGNFSVDVPVAAGTNLLHAEATDRQGNVGQESRAVVAGPMATLDRFIPDAITATISSETIDAIARGTETYLKSGDLVSALSGMNPVVDAGSTAGMPDCLYGQASITSFTMADADIVMSPVNGGIYLSAELVSPHIGMHLQWAVACADGSRDIGINASRVLVQGTLKIGVAGNKFDIEMVNQNVQIEGFDLDLGGVPGDIVDMLSLDTAMGPILGWATEKFVVPMLGNKLDAMANDTHEVQVLGSTLQIATTPSQVDFTPEGGMLLMNTSLRAKGDTGSFVYVANTLPDMDMSQGFQLAVADDAANQLLTSLYSAKGLDGTFDLTTGTYGEVGQLFDTVQLETKVPPFVDASGDKLVMTVGDMLASFELAGSPVTRVAINAQVALKVVEGADGKLRFDVGTPTTYVDVLDEAIEGSNQLSNAQFEAIVSFALGRIVQVGSGSLGAVPLPSFGGVGVTDLSIESQYGYLIVAGDVQ
jgi:hypothetical protein